MLDIKDLEIRHKRYKLKKNLPYIIIVVIIILFSFTPFLIISDSNYNEQQTLEKSEIVISPKNTQESLPEPLAPIKEVEPIKPIEVIQQIETNNTIIEEEKIVLAPSLNFMQKMTPDTFLQDKNINNNKKRTHIEKEIPLTDVEEIKEPLFEEDKVEDDKKAFVNIERNKDVNDIEEVIKRFKINNNPALSLFIAKKYYQLGEYEKAYDYALITNKINNNIDASWIIFTKSLVKMDKKEMAIQTLKKYIEYSNSPQAKQLLDEIVSGKFK